MANGKNSITPGQLMFLVIQTQIGIGVLYLPSEVHDVANGDAWISVLISGLFVQFFVVIIWLLSRRFPSANLYDYLPRLLGKLLGTIFHLAYILFFIIEGSFILARYGNVIEDWLLMETPRWIIIGLMCIVCWYLVQENLRTIARFFVFTSILILLLIVITSFTYSVHVNFLYIFPIGSEGWLNIFKGSNEAMPSLVGYELLLLCYPYTQGRSVEKLKAVSIATAFSSLFYVFLVFTSLVMFSPEQMKLLPQPVLYMVKALSFTLIERPDIYFISIWSLMAATSIMSYMFMAAKGISHLYKRQEKYRKAVVYTVIFFFIIALIPQEEQMIKTFGKISTIVGYVFIFVIPLFLLGISIITHKKEAGRISG
ncbi:GerAB/ArcD/ProY family transporter [Bacillus chungangensis]|uniref:Spore germination protein (Amino acid permease) n=1 Tax=Bacillus chungangensis TaxID=587633 RepID=A0ABT9WYE5_9BACI|nr:GerAB/ArcD/ProY family transporter [Bacillus chungangensis]MDQ0178250.1 spore germination protein (amino acid permease) [Bacillus chungangensis]